MIESSGKLIAEELAKAGTNPELIAKLKKDRITVDKDLPEMEFLLKLFDVPCCPRGELVAFTGKAKSGKTFVMSMTKARRTSCGTVWHQWYALTAGPFPNGRMTFSTSVRSRGRSVCRC